MTVEEFDKGFQYTLKLLDTIPIEQYLLNGLTANDIMTAIENDYDKKVENDAVLKGFVFNYFDEVDFMEYCKERYDTLWYEKIEYILQNYKPKDNESF